MATISLSMSVPSLSAPYSWGLSAEEPCFGEQRFKTARLVAGEISSICLAVAYRALAIVCWLFSPAAYTHYRDLSSYYYSRRLSRLKTYLDFGDKLVNFSWNGVFPTRQPAANHLDQLVQMHGAGRIAAWQRLSSDGLKLDSQRLKPLPYGAACCLGMSLDFAAHVVRQMGRGIAPCKAASSMGGRYEAGAPQGAQLIQACFNALDATVENERIYERFSYELRLRGEQFIEERQAHLAQLSPAEQELEVEALAAVGPAERMRLSDENYFARISALAPQLELSIDKCEPFLCQKKQEGSFNIRLARHIGQLPPAVYILAVNKCEMGHAIVLVKADNGDFRLFEPGHGSFALDGQQIGELLQKTCGGLVDDPKSFIGFYSCGVGR